MGSISSIKCIVETPKGSNAKYNYNPQLGHYELAKLLPAGLAFPYDFGYIPGTKGEDGDPLDAIIVSEFPSFPGCILDCRIIGAIKAVQYENMKGGIRNDRYLAIPQASVLYSDITDLRQLPGNISEELEQFFINYNKEEGKFFKPLSYIKSKKALKMIGNACAAEPSKLVQLLLPVTDNKGQKFPRQLYAMVRKKLARRFGGVTAYMQSPVRDIWKDHSKGTVSDQLIVYEVMVSKIDEKFWKSYKAKLERLFHQEKLIIRQSEIGLL